MTGDRQAQLSTHRPSCSSHPKSIIQNSKFKISPTLPPYLTHPGSYNGAAMRRNSLRADWFFPIKEAPVFATVTRNGKAGDVRVPNKKALIAADTRDILSNNTMTDIASRPPQSPRFRRDRPTLERRAGAWLRDFNVSAALPGFSIAGHLAELASQKSQTRDSRV